MQPTPSNTMRISSDEAAPPITHGKFAHPPDTRGERQKTRANMAARRRHFKRVERFATAKRKPSAPIGPDLSSIDYRYESFEPGKLVLTCTNVPTGTPVCWRGVVVCRIADHENGEGTGRLTIADPQGPMMREIGRKLGMSFLGCSSKDASYVGQLLGPSTLYADRALDLWTPASVSAEMTIALAAMSDETVDIARDNEETLAWLNGAPLTAQVVWNVLDLVSQEIPVEATKRWTACGRALESREAAGYVEPDGLEAARGLPSYVSFPIPEGFDIGDASQRLLAHPALFQPGRVVAREADVVEPLTPAQIVDNFEAQVQAVKDMSGVPTRKAEPDDVAAARGNWREMSDDVLQAMNPAGLTEDARKARKSEMSRRRAAASRLRAAQGKE